jgi:hypothetical protein
VLTGIVYGSTRPGAWEAARCVVCQPSEPSQAHGSPTFTFTPIQLHSMHSVVAQKDVARLPHACHAAVVRPIQSSDASQRLQDCG